MKNATGILISFVLCFAFTLVAVASNDTLIIKTKYAVPDGMGSLFLINDNNTLVKVDSMLNVTTSQSLISYGIASSIECNGGTEVVVYCYNTGRLVVFDNFLKEKNSYDLGQLINPKPNLICISKTGWWCYDETSLKISAYKSNFEKSYTLPEVESSDKEIVKMAEDKFSKPLFLYSDNSIRVNEVPSLNGRNFYNYDFIPLSAPCVNYNIPDILGYSNDTLQVISFKRSMMENPRLEMMHLHLKNIKMAVKSDKTYFFIQEGAILVFRGL